MPFEYEALVGHLYVVGGRAISSPPPGAFVEVAPRKVARGRETDTFFTLVLPSGETAAPAAFYESMARLAAEKYFNSTGSVTSGLRTVFQHLNDNLYEHNQNDPTRYEASMLCAVMRGTDLYLGRVGSGVALYRHNNDTQPFPADFDSDEALFGTPLGVSDTPDVRMARYTINAGTRVVLADAVLADLDYRRVTEALELHDIATVLVAMKDLVGQAITLSLIEFITPEQPSPLPIPETESIGGFSGARPTSSGEAAAADEDDSAVGQAVSRRSGRPSMTDRAVGVAAVGAANILEGAGGLVEKVLPEGEGRRFIPAPLMAAIALLMPVAVVILVVAMWLGGTGQSEFDQCVSEANRAAELARGIISSDVTGTLAAWNAVALVVNRCEQLRAGDPMMGALMREARSILDALLAIDRRPTTVVDTLPSARLTRGVLQGQDLYVLDDANDLVYRITLTEDGRGMVEGTRQPIAAMRRNSPVNQFTVGDIFDIGWAEDGAGVSQGNVIAALDRNGVLIDCPPRFLQNCNAQRLNIETWVNPVAMTFWQGRLYVLDPGANQLWRYDPSGSAFPNAPLEYFTGEGRPNLTGAVDFGIDNPGAVYILFENGVVVKFTGGRQENFAFANFPETQPMNRANAFSLNPNPPRQGMYFADAFSRTIFETTMAGTFVGSYRALDEDAFAQLGDVVVDTSKQLVYALSGNTIHVFSRQQQ